MVTYVDINTSTPRRVRWGYQIAINVSHSSCIFTLAGVLKTNVLSL